MITISTTTMKNENVGSWIQTDDLQWLYTKDKWFFHVVEVQEIIDYYRVVVSEIDLDCYEEKDIVQALSYFGYEIDEITDSQIIAECLAETDYDPMVACKGTFEDCMNWIKEYLDV